jgi:cobalamin biosynthetic protein CobC
MVPRWDAAPIEHGGDLAAARRLFPGAPEPFIDLSTGINPYPYAIPSLGADLFTRLPDPAALARLAAIAAQAYGAPTPAHVVAAPGTQVLLSLVATLVPPGRAAVLGPTYAEHARVAAASGHRTEEVPDIAGLRGADLAVVVNPNNPDGRIIDRESLLAVAGKLRPGGLLVIDEAFMDACAGDQSLAGETAHRNTVVLRSFGKFFGLAGVRLAFVLAAPALAQELAVRLGPWPVSGPAIVIGEAALADHVWASMTRARLSEAVERLDRHLDRTGSSIIGGTSLFRLVESPQACDLFHHLGGAGILVRRFAQSATWLRFGIPAAEPDWRRLEAALDSWVASWVASGC